MLPSVGRPDCTELHLHGGVLGVHRATTVSRAAVRHHDHAVLVGSVLSTVSSVVDDAEALVGPAAEHGVARILARRELAREEGKRTAQRTAEVGGVDVGLTHEAAR